MVKLATSQDYVNLFLLAAAFGALGGIAYELLLARKKRTAELRMPYFSADGRYVELGFVSSMILGAVAAMAISYFLTPEVKVTDDVNGVAVTTTYWSIVKVIPLSLIVGSGGGAFLEAIRGRLLGQLNAEKFENAKAKGKDQVHALAQQMKTLMAVQPAGTAQEIASRASRPFAAATSHWDDDLMSNLMAASPKYFASTSRQRLVEDHADTVQSAAHEVLAERAATTAELIDAGVKSAIAAIDALGPPLR